MEDPTARRSVSSDELWNSSSRYPSQWIRWEEVSEILTWIYCRRWPGIFSLFHTLNLCIYIYFVSQSVNVVECPEFRALLSLLRPDLGVPHRSKMRELILQAWRCYFQGLKRDLAVSSVNQYHLFSPIICIQSAPGCISFTVDVWSD